MENKIIKDCETCDFNMPVNGKFVCAGRTKEYGMETPIKGVDYNECWEESFFEWEDRVINDK